MVPLWSPTLFSCIFSDTWSVGKSHDSLPPRSELCLLCVCGHDGEQTAVFLLYHSSNKTFTGSFCKIPNVLYFTARNHIIQLQQHERHTVPFKLFFLSFKITESVYHGSVMDIEEFQFYWLIKKQKCVITPANHTPWADWTVSLVINHSVSQCDQTSSVQTKTKNLQPK